MSVFLKDFTVILTNFGLYNNTSKLNLHLNHKDLTLRDACD